jgi:hypothetical protein
VPRVLLPLLLLVLMACSAPAAPRATPPPPTRRAPAATATPDPAASALSVVPLNIDESALPPAEPTPPGFTTGRATPTPFATAEAAWKYVTINFAVENHSDTPWLVGIAGSEPSTTNLAAAVLTTRDGTRYKPMRTSTTLGLRTAVSHALTNYPVLLRIPPGFRVTGESAGSLSVVAPRPNSVTFKVPTTLTDYGTLSIPPPDLGVKSGEDDVSRRIRPLIGGLAAVDLSTAPSLQNPSFPAQNPPSAGVGGTVSDPGKATVTLVSVDASDPQDFELRNRGWKQVTLGVQYRNDDPQQAHAFNVAAWLFGDDGVAYTGDAPSIGDFGRSLTPPDPSAIALWDGRSAGTDRTPPGQALEPRRLVFVVPKTLHSAVLVLSGDADAAFSVTAIPVPGTP